MIVCERLDIVWMRDPSFGEFLFVESVCFLTPEQASHGGGVVAFLYPYITYIACSGIRGHRTPEAGYPLGAIRVASVEFRPMRR